MQDLILLAQQGDAKAQLTLADIYYYGKQAPQNFKNAIHWYTQAAQQGLAEAEYSLGEIYFHGHGIAKSAKIAVEWYEKAANQDHIGAICNLADMYDQGIGVAKNKEKAVFLYKEIAQQGNTLACFNLGNIFSRNPSDCDYIEAAKWYKQAADKNHIDAQVNLAYMCQTGQCSPALLDGLGAKDWYYKAAMQGSETAQVNLGSLCAQEGDESSAYVFWHLAARQGNKKAAQNIQTITNLNKISASKIREYVDLSKKTQDMIDSVKNKDIDSNVFGWSKETHDNFLSGALDDKPFSVLEKYVQMRGESFNEWLAVWRAYTGVALPQIVGRLYDLASTESELMDVKWAASSSDLAELCDNSIKLIRAGGNKITRDEKNAVRNEVSDFYRAIERMIFHVNNIISTDNDIWETPHLIGGMFSYAVVELSSFIRDNGQEINTFELMDKSSAYVNKYHANMNLHLPNGEPVDKNSLKKFYSCLMSLTILGRMAHEKAQPKDIIVTQCKKIIAEIKPCQPVLARQMNKGASKANQEVTAKILSLRKALLDLQKQKSKLELQKKEIMTPKELVQDLNDKNIIFANISARLNKTIKWIEKTKRYGNITTKKIIAELSRAEVKLQDDKKRLDAIKNEIRDIQLSIDKYIPDAIEVESLNAKLNEVISLIQKTEEEIIVFENAKAKFNTEDGILYGKHL